MHDLFVGQLVQQESAKDPHPMINLITALHQETLQLQKQLPFRPLIIVQSRDGPFEIIFKILLAGSYVSIVSSIRPVDSGTRPSDDLKMLLLVTKRIVGTY